MPKLHIIPNPCGITNTKYTFDPFNIAVHKFIRHMKGYGWDMIHYGHELSDVDCEHVTVIYTKDRPAPKNDQDIIQSSTDVIVKFNKRVVKELSIRKSPDDIIINFYGEDNRYVIESNLDLTSVEPSIGYDTTSVVSQYRGFTSYSQMHYYYGQQNMLMNPSWYDEVIPNAFTVSDFNYSAIQMTKHLGKKLIIAGPKEQFFLWNDTVPDHVELVGYLDHEKRKNFLSNIKALIAPSHYLEPFGNMVIEAALSGTPSITSDWGGFSETVVDGVTGYRCKDFTSFVSAINNIDLIDRATCRDLAIQRYSNEVIHKRFDTWLRKIMINDFYNI